MYHRTLFLCRNININSALASSNAYILTGECDTQCSNLDGPEIAA